MDVQASLLSLSPLSPPSSRIEELASQIVEGDFKSVLLSPEATNFLSDPSRAGVVDLFASVGLPSEVAAVGEGAGLESDAKANAEGDDESTGLLTGLVVGIACLHAFIQQNWTGPSLEFTPIDLFPSLASKTAASQADGNLPLSNESLHVATVPLLAKDGEPAYHLAKHPTLLLLAIRIFDLVRQRDTSRKFWSADWWRLRAAIVHQSLLDEPVPYDEGLQASLERFLETQQQGTTSLNLPEQLLAKLALEIGLSYHIVSQDRPAGAFFVQAAKLDGLEYHLTGALGKRTKFQVNELSQLVLLAKSKEREDGGASKSDAEAATAPETLALNDDTLLEQTEFTSTSMDNQKGSIPASLAELNPQDQPPLDPLDQSLLISMCLAQHNNTPDHGLTASQMAPFLDRVISHPRNWSVHTTALLLRARLEAKRTRTVERSALQLQALVDQMPTADSAVKERLLYFHQLPLPSKWEMEKELAQRFLSLGVVRSALEIFERLEMWEEAVRCLVNMDRSDRAMEIVHDLLEGKKEEAESVTIRSKEYAQQADKRARIDAARQAKLWCLLGDLQPEKAEEYYTKAWEVSRHTSSRSRRSLGAIYLAKQEFAKAIPLFQAALKINPLYARTWFALGCALVREERWEEAKDAFSRQVSIEEEDGEGWNNLAAVYLRMPTDASTKKLPGNTTTHDPELDEEEEPAPASVSESEEKTAADGIPFVNKLLAFRALRTGLRFSRDNWRMWQNYMVVAVDVGQLSEAARAQARLVEDRRDKDASSVIDEALLSKLVDAVTREDWNGGNGSLAEGAARTSNEGLGLLPIVNRLFDEVILPRVSDMPAVYTIQARLKRWQEDWSAALECYMRAYRAGIAQDQQVERDVKRWREAVEDLGELVDLMRNLGPRAKAQEEADGLEKGKAHWNDWKFQAKTVVRTFMGRTKDR